jgi:trigger factor
VKVSFPEDYGAANHAGKAAEFAVKVKEVAKPNELKLDDEMAKNLGLESLEKLHEIVKSQIESQFGSLTRQKVKRELLDRLDETYKFEAPSKLVDAEFENIWRQVNAELEQTGKTFADEDTTEEEAREEYRGLAERRVRLGLVLAEIGEKAEIQITDDEMQRALIEYVRGVPANQQREVFEFYRDNPNALANLRAPLFEEKVVDHMLTKIDVTDKNVTKEALLADDEDDAPAKPAKKAASKKKEAEPEAANDAGEAKKKAAPKKKAAAKKDDE